MVHPVAPPPHLFLIHTGACDAPHNHALSELWASHSPISLLLLNTKSCHTITQTQCHMFRNALFRLKSEVKANQSLVSLSGQAMASPWYPSGPPRVLPSGNSQPSSKARQPNESFLQSKAGHSPETHTAQEGLTSHCQHTPWTAAWIARPEDRGPCQRRVPWPH